MDLLTECSVPEGIRCALVGSCPLTYSSPRSGCIFYWTTCSLDEKFFFSYIAQFAVIVPTSRMDCFVYCLSTIDEPYQTYIGATMNLDKRLKQHNGILCGGARATSKRPGQWHRVCYVKGFDHWALALSFEWHWKHYSRKLQGPPLERRQRGLDTTLAWAAAKGFPRLEVVYE
jgi:structure-specific endonuclease subunit SLX1